MERLYCTLRQRHGSICSRDTFVNSEAFGNVNIESVSVGTPIVASNVGGIPEIVRDGVDGFLVPPDSPEKLTEAVRILLNDEDLHKKMSLSGRQRFLDLFELNSIINKHVNWFIDIVNTV